MSSEKKNMKPATNDDARDAELEARDAELEALDAYYEEMELKEFEEKARAEQVARAEKIIAEEPEFASLANAEGEFHTLAHTFEHTYVESELDYKMEPWTVTEADIEGMLEEGRFYKAWLADLEQQFEEERAAYLAKHADGAGSLDGQDALVFFDQHLQWIDNIRRRIAHNEAVFEGPLENEGYAEGLQEDIEKEARLARLRAMVAGTHDPQTPFDKAYVLGAELEKRCEDFYRYRGSLTPAEVACDSAAILKLKPMWKPSVEAAAAWCVESGDAGYQDLLRRLEWCVGNAMNGFEAAEAELRASAEAAEDN